MQSPASLSTPTAKENQSSQQQFLVEPQSPTSTHLLSPQQVQRQAVQPRKQLVHCFAARCGAGQEHIRAGMGWMGKESWVGDAWVEWK